jgi:hypothetical protein
MLSILDGPLGVAQVKVGIRVAILLTLFCPVAVLAGPPFQTDDPEPIDFRNYEFYTFASADGTPLGNGHGRSCRRVQLGRVAERAPSYYPSACGHSALE